MVTRRILATSGGFVPNGRGGIQPGGILLDALKRSGRERPRVLLVMTATGDNPSHLSSTYHALSGASCDVDHLSLFSMPNQPVEDAIGAADIIWVGGGSVANLLACWRIHEVDVALRDAWERGVILGGVSAGSICWHVGGSTDSYGPQLRPITDALGLLPYGNGVHYDSEAQRRPMIHGLVATGSLPMTYCTDDHVGIWYENTDAVEVVTDSEVDPSAGPAGHRVELQAGEVVETRLAPGLI